MSGDRRMFEQLYNDIVDLREDVWDHYPDLQDAMIGCPREVLATTRKHIKELERQNKVLREALEFYSKPINYNRACKKGKLVDDHTIMCADDCETLGQDMGMKLIAAGKRARKALKEVDNE